MPYTIGYLILGIPSSEIDLKEAGFTDKEIEDFKEEEETLDFNSGETPLVEFLYNGGEGSYCFIGEKLMEFDETEFHLLSDLATINPSEEQRLRSLEKVEKFEELFPEKRKQLPSVNIYIVWGTS